MPTIKAQLAIESHPSADHHYVFSPECLDSLAEQAKGLPVTVNFKGPPIGHVASTERTTDGVLLTMDVSADAIPLVAGPGFVATDQDWNDDYTERVINDADLREIGLTDD
jgi:hypothetical protein